MLDKQYFSNYQIHFKASKIRDFFLSKEIAEIEEEQTVPVENRESSTPEFCLECSPAAAPDPGSPDTGGVERDLNLEFAFLLYTSFTF